MAIRLLVFVVYVLVASGAKAEMSRPELESIAAKLAEQLKQGCPVAAYNDTAAFKSCAAALAHATFLPFANQVLWGGDQSNLKIKKRHLTKFNAKIFQTLYLPLLTFTGKWSIGHDAVENRDTIEIETYFRNALPAGEYPYPFWHSADKWNAYETMNRLSLYFDEQGHIVVVTRGPAGSNENRGAYAHVQPPAFAKDQWLWTDADGKQQPAVSLFSTHYAPSNPHLAALDRTYKAFALRMRDASCVQCHNPANPADANRLTLLQTPEHAAAEVDGVIAEVKSGSMPQDDLGLRKVIDPKLRAAILSTAQAFRAELTAADAWETKRVR